MHAKNFHHTGFNKWKAPVILFRQAFEEFEVEQNSSRNGYFLMQLVYMLSTHLCNQIHFAPSIFSITRHSTKKNKHYLSNKVFVHLLWFRLRVLPRRQRNYAYLKNKKGWESEKVKQLLRRCLAPGNKRILKKCESIIHIGAHGHFSSTALAFPIENLNVTKL